MKYFTSFSQAILVLSIGVCVLFSCNSKNSVIKNISEDPKDIEGGQIIFTRDCITCHNFLQDAIGPNLAGLTREVNTDWIRLFIKDPKKVIDTNDERAVHLFKKFNTYMPSFSMLSDQEVNQIIAYLHTFEQSEKIRPADTLNRLTNPIKEPIANSELLIDLKLFAQMPFTSDETLRTRIVKMNTVPGSKRMFVSDLRGQLYEMMGDRPIKVMDLKSIYPNFINKPGLGTGFGSYAFHPDFLNNGLLYITHTEAPYSATADFALDDSIKTELQWVLSEWKISADRSKEFKGEERELFRIDMPTYAHGVQDINFNRYAKKGEADFGLLYMGIGDGGSTISGHVSLVDSLKTGWGKIFRIHPNGRNSKNGNYGIPSDNPFVGDPNILPEIYAYGLRNPNRISWDTKGRILSSDIGEHHIEELNLVVPGRNYGYPFREGTFRLEPSININYVFPLPENDFMNYAYPVAQYDHGEGNAISGGYEYLGNNAPSLRGKYIFGDIANGRLFFSNIDAIAQNSQAKIYEWNISFNGKPTNLLKLCGGTRADLRFGIDADDELYIMTKADGKIYKIQDTKPGLDKGTK